MLLSRFFLPVLKETPKDAEIISHILMLRAGMIQQSSSGIYSWLPLGKLILENITVQNNNNFPGDLLNIKKIKILIDFNTLLNKTIEAKIVEIDEVNFYYQVLIENGKIIDNLSLINQAFKGVNKSGMDNAKIFSSKKN